MKRPQEYDRMTEYDKQLRNNFFFTQQIFKSKLIVCFLKAFTNDFNKSVSIRKVTRITKNSNDQLGKQV